ncbi:hypothetical protein [Pseudactinotalea suaedae]|uniref:hypothetical protein n=1 Tax=Pseudactinotalea suaedae TaxID=1524924 RepID=UPI0012E236A9|nr:hypothetical protein [Pseudactinotalea suaedae]
MSQENTHDDGREPEAEPSQPEHPSQAEGEDPDEPSTHIDPPAHGHPSQAEGEDGSA